MNRWIIKRFGQCKATQHNKEIISNTPVGVVRWCEKFRASRLHRNNEHAGILDDKHVDNTFLAKIRFKFWSFRYIFWVKAMCEEGIYQIWNFGLCSVFWGLENSDFVAQIGIYLRKNKYFMKVCVDEMCFIFVFVGYLTGVIIFWLSKISTWFSGTSKFMA